jgi:hypothetical protein
MSGFGFLEVFKCCGGDSRNDVATPLTEHGSNDQGFSFLSGEHKGGDAPDSPATPLRDPTWSKKNGVMRARANLRKSIVIRRRSMARIFQQEVLNVQEEYVAAVDEETDEETVAEVVAEEAGEITLDMVKKVMSGAKDRFDKACKYHAGSEEKDVRLTGSVEGSVDGSVAAATRPTKTALNPSPPLVSYLPPRSYPSFLGTALLPTVLPHTCTPLWLFQHPLQHPVYT